MAMEGEEASILLLRLPVQEDDNYQSTDESSNKSMEELQTSDKSMEGEEESSILFLRPPAEEDESSDKSQSTDESSDKSMEERGRTSDESIGENSPDKSDESMGEISPVKLGGSSDISLEKGSDRSMEEDRELMEIMERISQYSDEELLSLIEKEQRYAQSSQKFKKKLVPMLRRYFNYIIKSQGFECIYYPGPISNLTTLEPRDQLVFMRNCYPECHRYVLRMAKSAIDIYNKDVGTRFRVQSIENVTLWKIRNRYYITFIGLDEDYEEQKFQAIVQDIGTQSNVVSIEKEESDIGTQSNGGSIENEESDIGTQSNGGSIEKEESVEEERPKKLPEDDYWSNGSIEEVSSFSVLLVHKIGTKHENIVSDEEFDMEDDSDEDDPNEYNPYGTTSSEDENDSNGADLGTVDIFSSIDGSLISNDELIRWMSADPRPLEVKWDLLHKVRIYLKTISESEGFECTHYPGHIMGVTTIQPRQFVIDKHDKYPEGYRHIMFLASLAMNDHNNKCGTKFQVMDINKVNVRSSFSDTYYITFSARDQTTNDELIFQAKVLDNVCVIWQKVLSCRRIAENVVSN